MRADPDIELMLNFKKGDVNAFQMLFDKYKKRVINYCYRFSGNHAIAEELAQETFIRVYQGAGRYRPKARFSTWIFKIATNVCLNELRKPVYRNKVESLDNLNGHEGTELKNGGPKSVHEDLEDNETQHVIRKAMKALPEKQRAALLLRIDEEFSYKEIGKQMGCSENHVKILIYRAREKLKDMLEQGNHQK